MNISRRIVLQGAAALPLAASSFGFGAAAQTSSAPAGDIPPILFVHGNGDHAALWMTTLWRMESNGISRDRMFAINFTDPLARTDDTVAQANRSSTEDQRRELGDAIRELKRRTGAARVALVGNSRGGNSIRSTIKNGGAADVSHAVLCGVPNHGVYDWEDGLGGEFNGRGPFLRGLNEGETEVTPGTAFLTLRSDGMDKYAQADGRFVGKPGTPTGITSDGPALKGATNLVLGTVDHRETAFHPRAFREIYKFIAGREPERIAITPEPDGQTERPCDRHARRRSDQSPGRGRIGRNLSRVAGYRRTHRRRDPCLANGGGRALGSGTGRSVVVLWKWSSPRRVRPPRISIVRRFRVRPMSCTFAPRARWRRPKPRGAVVIMSRPRGYFGLPRDVVLLDGKEPADVKPGVPTDSITTARLRPRRPAVPSWRCSIRSGLSRGPGRRRKTGFRSRN